MLNLEGESHSKMAQSPLASMLNQVSSYDEKLKRMGFRRPEAESADFQGHSHKILQGGVPPDQNKEYQKYLMQYINKD